MALWIESFTNHALSQTDPKRLPFKARMACLKKGWTTERIKRAALELTFFKAAARGNWVEPERLLSPSDMPEWHEDFHRRLAPFILPELAHIPIAFDVDAQTVAEFAGAEIKPSVIELAKTRLREWQSTYLDFPEGSAILEDGWFARAVIVSQLADNVSKWSAVIRKAHDTGAMVLTWYVVEDYGHYPGSLVGYNDDFQLLGSCGRWSEFIANLAYLCAAWFGTTTVIDDSAHSRKPYQTFTEDDRRSVGSGGTEGSRFRVVKLLPPAAQPMKQPATGSKCSRHIRVRGHFKIVRYGRRYAYHRLQWVNSYEKGPRHQPLETRVAVFKIDAAAA